MENYNRHEDYNEHDYQNDILDAPSRITLIRGLFQSLSRDLCPTPDDSELVFRLSQSDELCLGLSYLITKTTDENMADIRPIIESVNYAIELYHSGVPLEETVNRTVLNLSLLEAVPESANTTPLSEMDFPFVGDFSNESILQIVRNFLSVLSTQDAFPEKIRHAFAHFGEDEQNCFLMDAALTNDIDGVEVLLAEIVDNTILYDYSVEEIENKFKEQLYNIANMPKHY